MKAKTLLTVLIAALLTLTAGTTATVLVLNHQADVAAQERKVEAQEKQDRDDSEAAEAKAIAEAEQLAEEEEALQEARDVHVGCTDQLGPLITQLGNINARLDVGLAQSELSDMLGKASIAYSRIDIDAIGDGNCLMAGAKLETAFNKYNATVGSWEDCIYDYYCDVDADVLPGIQLKWSHASTLIERAEVLVATLDPDGATYKKEAGQDA